MTARRPVVIKAGKFNAYDAEWASRFKNQRGQILQQALSMLDVDLANVGTKRTVSRDIK